MQLYKSSKGRIWRMEYLYSVDADCINIDDTQLNGVEDSPKLSPEFKI